MAKARQSTAADRTMRPSSVFPGRDAGLERQRLDCEAPRARAHRRTTRRPRAPPPARARRRAPRRRPVGKSRPRSPSPSEARVIRGVRGDRRHAAGERLAERVGQSLARRRMHHHVAGRVQRGHVVPAVPSQRQRSDAPAGASSASTRPTTPCDGSGIEDLAGPRDLDARARRAAASVATARASVSMSLIGTTVPTPSTRRPVRIASHRAPAGTARCRCRSRSSKCDPRATGTRAARARCGGTSWW